MSKSLKMALTALVGVALSATANSAVGNLLNNGDFETGDLAPEWSNEADAEIVSGSSAIAGDFSAFVPITTGTAFANGMYQSFAPLTAPNTTTFLFSMPDPGGAGDRGLNVQFWNTSQSRLNLRVVDIDNNGIGDVQMFHVVTPPSTGAWQTILSDVVDFGQSNSLSLEIHDFGANLNYSVTVNGNTASNLNWSQLNNVPFTEYKLITFVGNLSQVAYTVDNVSVTLNPIVPEPQTMLLGVVGAVGLIGFGLRGRRRRRGA